MNKKSLKYLSVIVIFFLGFFAVNAIELNNINTNYSVGDTLGVGWFNNLKSRIKDIYGNGLNVGIGTSTPTQKLDVVGNVNSNGYCINGVCKNSWDPNSPWNISGDNIYFTGGSVGIGIENPAGFLNLEERDAGPNSAGDGASLVIGDVNGVHLELDNNEIHAMDGNNDSTLFLNNNGGKTLVGGNIFINNSTPTIYLQDNNARSAMVHVNDNKFYILRGDGVNSTAWTPINGYRPLLFNLENNNAQFGGIVYALGGFQTSSDINLKKNLKNISSPIEKIKSMNGYTFEWKANGKKDIGLIAQEVEKVFPMLVNKEEGSNYKSVNYGGIIAPMIEAIKEQQKQIEKLQEEIEILKKEKK